MENKKFKLSSVLALLFFVLFCCSVFLNYKLAGYLDEYDEQVEKQDSMIQRLSFSNELVKEYFDIEEDTVAHVTKFVEPEFVRDGKKMTSDELVASINADDHESVEAIRTLVDKYNTLVHDYNELGEKAKAISDSVVIQGMALNLIKRNYGIDYTSNKNGDMRTVHVQGDKVDSALILLPYYRHKLSYDPKSNAWIVEYQKTVAK